MWYRKTGGMIYVNRGDVAGADFDKGDLTLDNAYHDLDLSSIVPASVRLIRVKSQINDDFISTGITFREKGYSNAVNAENCIVDVVNFDIIKTFFLGCNSSQVIQYKATNTVWTGIYFTVLGWLQQ